MKVDTSNFNLLLDDDFVLESNSNVRYPIKSIEDDSYYLVQISSNNPIDVMTIDKHNYDSFLKSYKLYQQGKIKRTEYIYNKYFSLLSAEDTIQKEYLFELKKGGFLCFILGNTKLVNIDNPESKVPPISKKRPTVKGKIKIFGLLTKFVIEM